MLVLGAVLALGCGQPLPGGAAHPVSVGSSRDAVLTTNALTTNALTTNALTTNALTTNALTTNALTTNALTTNALTTNALNDVSPCDPGASLSKGQCAAMVIKYSARCMLSASQSVSVTYNDLTGASHTDVYPGNIGLQPNWVNAGLSSTDIQWWVACLAAHVNANGTPINFSARGTHPALSFTAAEGNSYTQTEGTFWGTYNPSAPDGSVLHFYACPYMTSMQASVTGRLCTTGGCGSMFTVDVTACPRHCMSSEAYASDNSAVWSQIFTGCDMGAYPDSQFITTYLP